MRITNWEQFIELQDDTLMSICTALTAKKIKKAEIYYPKDRDVLKFTQLTRFKDIKVVILGQDPYHGDGQATGLAFSVNKGQKIPPSLRNIYKELNADTGLPIPSHGDLTSWARQGVLLLNEVLTVKRGTPGSHANLGWQRFTHEIIEKLSKKGDIAFLLWGHKAQSVENLISDKNLILKAAHPSPFSAHKGFLGCKHFSKVNEYLKSKGKGEINWEIQ